LLKREELSEDDIGSGFLTEQIVQEILDNLKTWQTSNSEPVGLLWHDMLKYVKMCVYLVGGLSVVLSRLDFV